LSEKGKEKDEEPLVPRHLLRYAHIGVAVGFVVMLVGGFLFKNSEGAMHAVGIVGFLTACAVYRLLDERNQARERREGKDPL
jgi:hypothetical protein